MFQKNDEVYFGRRNGEKTLGKIIKVNRKTYKIEQLEGRGMKVNHRVGKVWVVPHSLCWSADEGRPGNVERRNHVLTPIKTGRTEREIMTEIGNVYGQLSPENLHCDGEISLTEARRRGTVLRRQLKALFQEIGREVDEIEAYRYFQR